MKSIQFTLVILLTALFLFSCKKDIPSVVDNGFPVVKSHSIYSVIKGRVVFKKTKSDRTFVSVKPN